MSDFECKNWGDLATLSYGKALRGPKDTGKYPVFGTNGRIGLHTEYLCQGPGIIIGRKGAYRGVEFSDVPFFVIDTAFYLVPVTDFDMKWAYYQLKCFDINSIDSGSAIPSTSREAFYQIPVLVPVLPTQGKIASILSAYDDLIENNLRRIKILEEMAQNLYHEWFVKFRFPGHEKVKFVDSSLGKIPEGWEVVPFTDVTDVLSGGTPKTSVDEYWNGEIPFFTPKDASDAFYVVDTDKAITKKGLSKCNSKLYQKNTVFITARGTVGKVTMPSREMAMNQSCYALRGKSGVDQYYLFLCTRHQVDYLKMNTGGATFNTIVVDTFKRMKILLPCDTLIHRFSLAVTPYFELALNCINRNTTLRQTRDLLLPKLISGELDVSDLDIEVPEETA